MLNQVVVVGRIVKDLIVQDHKNDRKTLTMTLAVQREYKNYDGEYDVDFIDITLWDGLAESYANYAKKGNMVAVKGRLAVEKITTAEGQKVKSLQLIGTRVVYLSSNPRKEEEK